MLPSPEGGPAAEPLCRLARMPTSGRLRPLLQGPCCQCGESAPQGARGSRTPGDLTHRTQPCPQLLATRGHVQQGSPGRAPAGRQHLLSASTAVLSESSVGWHAREGAAPGHVRSRAHGQAAKARSAETLRTHTGADLREVSLLHPHRETRLSCPRPRLRTGRPPGHCSPEPGQPCSPPGQSGQRRETLQLAGLQARGLRAPPAGPEPESRSGGGRRKPGRGL